MPADISAFLQAQPAVTGQLRGLHASSLVEASVARRLAGGV
jgi:hypothetical protein